MQLDTVIFFNWQKRNDIYYVYLNEINIWLEPRSEYLKEVKSSLHASIKAYKFDPILETEFLLRWGDEQRVEMNTRTFGSTTYQFI